MAGLIKKHEIKSADTRQDTNDNGLGGKYPFDHKIVTLSAWNPLNGHNIR